MNISEFEKIVQTYGAKPQNWPSSVRSIASDFAQANQNAQLLLAEESTLDSLLDS